MSERRELTAALLGCLGGSALVLLAAGRPWVHAVAVQEPLRVELAVRGGSLSPVVPALGLVALASTVALIATRGPARRLLGLVLLGAGLGMLIEALRRLKVDAASIADRAGPAVGSASARAESVEVTAWPWVAVLGGLLCLASGALTLVRGPRWPGMSSRYDAPSQSVSTPAGDAPTSPLDQWRALDRGEDPTVVEPGEPDGR